MDKNDSTMKNILLLFMVMLISTSWSQQTSKNNKRSTAKGSMFFYWGYNRSVYSKSNLRFIGPGYDFTLKGVQAKDRPSEDIKTYVSLTDFTVPQFNFRIGYNIKKNWALSLGYDHMKYVMKAGPTYFLNGTINPGIDPVTNWSGTYNNEPVVTNGDTFHYENTNGLNYIHADISNVFKVYQSDKGHVALTTLWGFGAGPVLSFNDFTFAGQKNMATVSISGFGVSAHAGLRAEFFRRVFIQTNLTAGFIDQVRVKTRPNDYDSHAKQVFVYSEGNIVIGALFYLKQGDKCGTCPFQ
jgi:hypothetical protein